MKSLLKYLSPFAPDLAGAVSVLFELDGVIVICDAGGCTGNICGFDEPRWFTRKSALFSAGLRDIDAILGRDKIFAEKLIAAAKVSDRKFMAVVGSPVPAVIATDFFALKRMCTKELDIPVLTLEASGTEYYEKGASLAYLSLFKTFAVEQKPVKKNTIGVLGVTPLDYSTLDAAKIVKSKISGDVRVYGMDSSLEEVINASEVEKNIVVSPSGLKAAEYLKRTFNTPYEISAPGIDENIVPGDLNGKKILIVHQVFGAWELKKKIENQYRDVKITTGSFFNSISKEADHKFASEADFRELFENNKYDLVIADTAFERIVKDIHHGEWVDFPHFAVSGKLLEEL